MGGGHRRRGDCDWRQRARLLPATRTAAWNTCAFERVAALATRAGVEGRSLQIRAAPRAVKADIIRRDVSRPRLRADAQRCDLGPEGVDAAAATAASFGPAVLRTPASRIPSYDRTPLLPRSLSPRVRRRWWSRRRTRAPGGRAQPDGLLSDIPAASPTTSAPSRTRACSTSSMTLAGRVLHVLERSPGRRARPAGSTKRGASITCSSTPGSMCRQRRVRPRRRPRPRAFILAPTIRRSIWGASSDPPRSRARSARPIASSGTIAL